MAAEEDSKEMVSQKAAARSSKMSLKPKKLTQISEPAAKIKNVQKTSPKQGSFDNEIDSRKKATKTVRSVKENKPRMKFKAKNTSKSRHKKRR